MRRLSILKTIFLATAAFNTVVANPGDDDFNNKKITSSTSVSWAEAAQHLENAQRAVTNFASHWNLFHNDFMETFFPNYAFGEPEQLRLENYRGVVSDLSFDFRVIIEQAARAIFDGAIPFEVAQTVFVHERLYVTRWCQEDSQQRLDRLNRLDPLDELELDKLEKLKGDDLRKIRDSKIPLNGRAAAEESCRLDRLNSVAISQRNRRLRQHEDRMHYPSDNRPLPPRQYGALSAPNTSNPSTPDNPNFRYDRAQRLATRFLDLQAAQQELYRTVNAAGLHIPEVDALRLQLDAMLDFFYQGEFSPLLQEIMQNDLVSCMPDPENLGGLAPRLTSLTLSTGPDAPLNEELPWYVSSPSSRSTISDADEVSLIASPMQLSPAPAVLFGGELMTEETTEHDDALSDAETMKEDSDKENNPNKRVRPQDQEETKKQTPKRKRERRNGTTPQRNLTQPHQTTTPNQWEVVTIPFPRMGEPDLNGNNTRTNNTTNDEPRPPVFGSLFFGNGGSGGNNAL